MIYIWLPGRSPKSHPLTDTLSCMIFKLWSRSSTVPAIPITPQWKYLDCLGRHFLLHLLSQTINNLWFGIRQFTTKSGERSNIVSEGVDKLLYSSLGRTNQFSDSADLNDGFLSVFQISVGIHLENSTDSQEASPYCWASKQNLGVGEKCSKCRISQVFLCCTRRVSFLSWGCSQLYCFVKGLVVWNFAHPGGWMVDCVDSRGNWLESADWSAMSHEPFIALIRKWVYKLF